MAGSIITKPNTKIGQWLQRDLLDNHLDHEGVWAGDAHAINVNSVDFSHSSTIDELASFCFQYLALSIQNLLE